MLTPTEIAALGRIETGLRDAAAGFTSAIAQLAQQCRADAERCRRLGWHDLAETWDRNAEKLEQKL